MHGIDEFLSNLIPGYQRVLWMFGLVAATYGIIKTTFGKYLMNRYSRPISSRRKIELYLLCIFGLGLCGFYWVEVSTAYTRMVEREEAHRQVKRELQRRLDQYYTYKYERCIPSNIGTVESGAAETPNSCEGHFVDWANGVIDYLDKNMDEADSLRFRGGVTYDDKAKILDELIRNYK